MLIPLFVGHLLEVAVAGADGVHQTVELAPPLRDCVEAGSYRVGVRHVDAEADDIGGTRGTEYLLRLLQSAFAPCDHRDFCPLGRKGGRDRQAHALATPGHHGRRPGQAQIHCSTFRQPT